MEKTTTSELKTLHDLTTDSRLMQARTSTERSVLVDAR